MGRDPGLGQSQPTTAPVTVRWAETGDLAAVCDLVNEYVVASAVNFRTEPQTVDAWLQEHARWREAYPWLVAELGGVVAGVAYAGPWNPRGAYAWTAETTVYVARRAPRRGVGSALYGRLLDVLDRQGFRSLVAVITLPNEPSVRLHERFGFERVGVLADAGYKLGGWHDVGLWQKLLGPRPPGPPLPVRAVGEVGGRDDHSDDSDLS